ncbi:MAG: hypothetical protein HC846_00930 [Blastocatellia bacterium]|nr:hypothetical protein [Blastocatellia bacterium]
MSGKKDSSGERERRSVGGSGRRLSLENIAEIKRTTDIVNSQTRRKGKTPKKPKIVMFSCACNCFSIIVD